METRHPSGKSAYPHKHHETVLRSFTTKAQADCKKLLIYIYSHLIKRKEKVQAELRFGHVVGSFRGRLG